MIRRSALLLALTAGGCAAGPTPGDETSRWEARARNVSIIRDDWGIPHIHGKSDADAVFGLMYAQAEDDFNRVETNYLNSMGRLAEAEGERAIWRDLCDECKGPWKGTPFAKLAGVRDHRAKREPICAG